MNELSTFEALLSSLAPVCRLHFQIWNKAGKMIFSTGAAGPEDFPLSYLQGVVKSIIGENSFRYHLLGQGFLCGCPLADGRKVLGVLLSGCRSVDGLNPGSMAAPGGEKAQAREMESFLASLAALVEEKFNIQREIEEMAHELDHGFEDLYLYARIASQIKGLKLSDDMLKILMQELLESMRVDAVFVRLSYRRECVLNLIPATVSERYRVQPEFFEKILPLISADATVQNENYFIVNDSRTDPRCRDLLPEPYRFLAVRVQHQGEHYGWLGLLSYSLSEIFRQGELKLLLSLSEQLGMMIDNLNLYRNLEEFVVNMVKSLVFAIEAKDRYTRGHSERVSTYCMLMGKRLSLNEKEHEELKWSSILHDIGKIGIPESILNKSEPLTDAEFEIIKSHPVKGSKILMPLEYLADALPAILHHHERYDGSGYPDGLKGEKIPLPARIIAVADTFDAINSSRPYRDAVIGREALHILEEVSGIQLDPRLVEIFRQVYTEDLQAEYQEKPWKPSGNKMSRPEAGASIPAAEPS